MNLCRELSFPVLSRLVTQSCSLFCLLTSSTGGPHGNCAINDTCWVKHKIWHPLIAHNTVTNRNMKSQHLLKLREKLNYLRFLLMKFLKQSMDTEHMTNTLLFMYKCRHHVAAFIYIHIFHVASSHFWFKFAVSKS